MKRARLAWLVSGLGVVERGGERITLDLVRHLRSFFDITLFGRACVDGQVRKVCALARDKWPVASDFERLPAFIRAVFRRLHLTPVEVEMLTFSLSALRPLWRERFDAHLLSTGVWGSRLARLFRLLRGIPFVYVGHGGYWGEVSNAQQLPDLHIFVNQAVMEKVQRSVPGLRAVFIPNGVDLDRFAPRPSSLGWELERPTYLAVGALVREKHLDLAIRAVASLPNGSLVVVGAGLEERSLKKLGEELLGPKRFLLTAAPFAAMPEYYNACDVFTLPSLAEPFGLVYLEAMACGKPVVAPKDGMREFIVGNAGILCDCTDAAAYAAALSEAARGSARGDPRREAERFDVRIVAQNYARAIQAVLNARNR